MLRFLFSFQGRICRLAWWSVTTLCFSILIVTALAAVAVTDDALLEAGMLDPITSAWIVLVYLLTIWMTVASTVKRYHDRDKSGWWSLISLIPFGVIVLYIECGFFSGTEGPNSYGESHEEASNADLIEYLKNDDVTGPHVETQLTQHEKGRQSVKINRPTGAVFGRRVTPPYSFEHPKSRRI